MSAFSDCSDPVPPSHILLQDLTYKLASSRSKISLFNDPKCNWFGLGIWKALKQGEERHCQETATSSPQLEKGCRKTESCYQALRMGPFTQLKAVTGSQTGSDTRHHQIFDENLARLPRGSSGKKHGFQCCSCDEKTTVNILKHFTYVYIMKWDVFNTHTFTEVFIAHPN